MRQRVIFLLNFTLFLILLPFSYIGVREAGKILGLVRVPVEVAGTGSMYPSLFWSVNEGGPDDVGTTTLAEYRQTPRMYYRFPGLRWQGKVWGERLPARFDLVAFHNARTAQILTAEAKADPQAGFVKRVIGMPGDQIELRDGFVWINGTVLAEPYLLAPRITYGGTRLADCQPETIPPDQYFVLGDNRKVSVDSRGELGLVSLADIDFVLPLSEQTEYRAHWRDPAADSTLLATPTLQPSGAWEALNQARSARGLSPLSTNAQLAKAAELSADAYQNQVELSLSRSLAQAGYQNIVTGQVVLPGYYTAEEWIANLLAYEKTAKHLLSPDYDEVGIAINNTELNHCPSQVIVAQFGGYLPPNYPPEQIANWERLAENLRSVIPSWRDAESQLGGNPDLARLVNLLQSRLALADEILATMRAKKWLSASQEARIEADRAHAEEAERLIKQLNQQ